MTSINRSIRILKSIIYVSIALILAAQVLYWVVPFSSEYIEASHPIIDRYASLEELDSTQKVLGFIIALVPKVALVWAFILLLKLCNSFSNGDWFNKESERHCDQIGRWMIVYVILAIVHRTLLVYVVTMNNPVGEREFSISVSTNDLMALLPALLAFIIGHMVGVARRQRDELNEII